MRRMHPPEPGALALAPPLARGGRSGTGSGSARGGAELAGAPGPASARGRAAGAALGHGSASPVSQAGPRPPGQLPKKSMPSAPSQNAWTRRDACELEHDQRARDNAEDPHERGEQAHAPRAQRQHHEQERQPDRPGGGSAISTPLVSLRSSSAIVAGVASDRLAGRRTRRRCRRLERSRDRGDRVQDRGADHEIDEPGRHAAAAASDGAEQVEEDPEQQQRGDRREHRGREVAAGVLVDREQEVGIAARSPRGPRGRRSSRSPGACRRRKNAAIAAGRPSGPPTRAARRASRLSGGGAVSRVTRGG